jgi:ABC-type branched-subunit amino acid transport system substrate-binding protein
MAPRMIRSRSRLAGVLAAAGLAAVTAGTLSGAATGGVDAQAAASTCSGAPVKIMEIVTLTSPVFTNFPEFAAGAKAAAFELTKSCKLGRPIQVIICDDVFNPNTAQQCARQAVADKVVAVLYSGSAYGDQILSVIGPAGIPSLNNGSSPLETTSGLSFPTVYARNALGGAANLVIAAGGKNIGEPANDLPVVAFLSSIAEKVAKALGGKITRIPVPVTTVDMAPFAAQVIAGGYDGVTVILDAAKVISLVKALKQQGANFHKLPFATALSNFTPLAVQAIGPSIMDGVLAPSVAVPPNDPTSPIAKRIRADLAASGQSTGPVNLGVFCTVGWADVQMVAQALAGQKQMTARTLVQRLNAGVVKTTEFGLPPIDFTKPAFPKDPTLVKTRTFSRDQAFYRFNSKGIPIRVTKAQWVDITHLVKLTG